MEQNVVEILDLEKVKDLLEKTPYQKLKPILEKQGIGEAWKPGKKKEDIIARALELYEELKNSIREEQKKDEDPETPVETDLEKAIVPPIEPESETKIIPQYAKSKLIDSKLSKEDLEKNLRNINLNLKGGVPSHRTLLLAKKQEIEDLLKEMKNEESEE